MATFPTTQSISFLQRLFSRRIAGLKCLSRIEDKAVCLPSEFVAGSREIKISFVVEWPWLMPRLWPPPVSIKVLGENGGVPTPNAEPAVTIRRRQTDVTLTLGQDALAARRRLRVEVARTEDGRQLEQFDLSAVDLEAVAEEIELLIFETYALQPEQQVLTRRFHHEVEQIESDLHLRLPSPDHASFLDQMGAELSLQLGPSDGACTRRWSTGAFFERGALRWKTKLGPPATLFAVVPGQYRLLARMGEHPLGERLLEVVPFNVLLREAQDRVLRESTVVEHAFSALNHRDVCGPVQVVAEDFRRLDASVTLACPLPEPLLLKVTQPLRLGLSKDGKQLRTFEMAVALQSGRNYLAASFPLEAALFDDGPGLYTLELWLGERSLAKTDFQHRIRQQLKEAQAEAIFQSLELQEARLFALREGERLETDFIFPTDEAVIPKIKISGNGFDDEVPAIQWRLTLRLIRLDTNTVTEKHRFLTANASATTHEVGRLRPHANSDTLPPGSYAYQFWKRQKLLAEFRFRVLAVEEIAPYTQSVVRQSLRADNVRLFAIAAGFQYKGCDIPDSTEFIVPEFTLHSSGYNRFLPRWRTELTLELQTPNGERRDLGNLPVLLAAEPLTVSTVHVRWGGTAFGYEPGRHHFFVKVAEKQLVCIPFQVLTPAEVTARIQVSNLTIEAVTKSGKRLANPTEVYLSEINFLAVSCELTIGLPAPGQSTDVSFELDIDGTIVAQISSDVSLARRVQPFKLRPVSLADLLPRAATGTKSMSIIVGVASQMKDQRLITLVCYQRITNFEGQLSFDPSCLDVSDEEYQTILNNL